MAPDNKKVTSTDQFLELGTSARYSVQCKRPRWTLTGNPYNDACTGLTACTIFFLLLQSQFSSYNDAWLNQSTQALKVLAQEAGHHPEHEKENKHKEWVGAAWNETEKNKFREKLESCDPEAEKTLREYFHDIVLIINNNDEKHAVNTTVFWLKFYSRFFDNIVVISAEGLPGLGIERAAEFYPDAPVPWWGTWMYHYWALRKIMPRFPDAAGFLWTNDDVVINYWNIVGADKDRLWLPNNPEKYEYQVFSLNPSKKEEERMKGNWASRVQFRKQLKLAFSLMDPKYRDQYRNSNLPRKDVYHKRGCDLWYIPQRLAREAANDVLPALQLGHVASELAIPVLFFSLDHPDSFSPVLHDMVYRWDMWLGGRGPYNPAAHWNANISGFHPWKVSSDHAKVALLKSLSVADGCLSKYQDVLVG